MADRRQWGLVVSRLAVKALFSRCGWLLLVGLTWPVASFAQSAPADTVRVEREVVASSERAAVVYGAADVALQLVFDAPLQRTDGGVVVVLPGMDVRPHPFLSNALIITPSKLLSERSVVPLRVPLANGVAALTLTFNPERADHVLRVLRRPAIQNAGAGPPLAEIEALLRFTAQAVLGDMTCREVKSPLPQPEKVAQVLVSGNQVMVCLLGAYEYIQVRRQRPGCVPDQAQLRRGNQAFETLLLDPAGSCANGTCQTLVVHAPPAGVDELELELLAADGTVCERYSGVKLQPGGVP